MRPDRSSASSAVSAPQGCYQGGWLRGSGYSLNCLLARPRRAEVAISGKPYFHIARIRAPTSIRICCALRSDAAADTSGQVIVSKNCNNVAGMKRVRAA